MNNSKQTSSPVAVRERRFPRAFGWPEDIERFFDRAFRGGFPRPWLTRPGLHREAGWLPDMDVFERNGKSVVRMDLPGLKREDIEVTVEDDVLVIRGHREEEKEVKEDDYYCAERATGEFSRAIRLPKGASGDGIEATYADGVLEVTMPSKAATAEKSSTKIDVK